MTPLLCNDAALVFLNCNGFREAADDLENPCDRRPVYNLFVRRREGNDAAADDDARVFFPRFVDLLGRGRRQQREGGTEGGGGGSFVQDIHFMVDWSVLPISDMERLFGTVLPNHDTLRGIAIDISGLPTTYLRMLTESIPTTSSRNTTSLSSLRLLCSAGALDPTTQADVAQVVADMLKRNVSLRTLLVDVNDLGVDATSRIGRALRVVHKSARLEHLSLHVKDVSAEALADLGSATSASLRFLHVSATTFAYDAVEALATQLRTNVTLQNLLLTGTIRGGYSVRDCVALIDLVKTYNYTLDGIYGELDETTVVERVPVRESLDFCLHRNRRIRTVLEQLRREFDSTAPTSSTRISFTARERRPEGPSSSSTSTTTSLLSPLLPLVLGSPVNDHLNALFRVVKMDFVVAAMGRLHGEWSAEQGAGSS